MKKMYKKPIVEKSEMLPQSIICASVTENLEGTAGIIVAVPEEHVIGD